MKKCLQFEEEKEEEEGKSLKQFEFVNILRKGKTRERNCIKSLLLFWLLFIKLINLKFKT